MHLFFTGGESIARDWIAGRDAFEPALGGDATGELGIDQMSGARRLGSSPPLGTSQRR
jgi:hypothetical protein